jgi:transcriptional regulator with XRE-family HTH domain
MEKLNNLQRIRKEQGLSRRELELLSGVKQVTIHHLENGTTNVNMVKLGTLIALAKSLHCKVVDLLDTNLKRIIG